MSLTNATAPFFTSPGDQLRVFTISTTDSDGNEYYLSHDTSAGSDALLTSTTAGNSEYWAFFAIAGDSSTGYQYVIANYGTGGVLGTIPAGNGAVSVCAPFGSDSVSANSYALKDNGTVPFVATVWNGALNPQIATLSLDSSTSLYSIYLSGPEASGYLEATTTISLLNAGIYSESQASDAAVWTIADLSEDVTPALPAVPSIPTTSALTAPTLTGFDAPQYYPSKLNASGQPAPDYTTVYTGQMPYFFAVDSGLSDPALQIQQSPYYAVEAMGYYNRVSVYNNEEGPGLYQEDVSFEYGMTTSEATTMSTNIGITIGFKVQTSEGFLGDGVKESFSSQFSMNFGYSSTSTTTSDTEETYGGTMNVPKGSLGAIYAPNFVYYLYRANDTTAVSSYTNAVQMGTDLIGVGYPSGQGNVELVSA